MLTKAYKRVQKGSSDSYETGISSGLLKTAFLENELKQNLLEKNCQIVPKCVNADVSFGPKSDYEKYGDDNSLMLKNSSTSASDQLKRKKLVTAGESLLNGNNEKSL